LTNTVNRSFFASIKFIARGKKQQGMLLLLRILIVLARITVVTSNLSKAHVTRDISGPATWTIKYRMQ